MALIIDPDDLNQGTEVTITTGTKTIDLNIAGNLSTDGVTLKALYSFLKEEWKNDANLIKFPFPMIPITDEQFEFVRGWNMFDDAARELIRTGGWAVIDEASGNATERWSGVITLGTIESDDQVYYIQEDTTTATTTDFALTGSVNQAVQIWSDPNADGNPADGFDRTGFLRLYLREYDQAYDDVQLTDIGVTTMTFQVYRFPLTTTSDDPKITVSEAAANAAPFTDVDMEFTPGNGFTTWANSTSYAADDVVQSATDLRWYHTAAGGTSSGDDTDLAGGSDTGVTWTAFIGERQIGSVFCPFNWLIDADVDDSGTGQSAEEVYTRIQFLLRQATDIDTGVGTSNGKTTKLLLNFIGDTLVTTQGVYIDDFDPADTNRLTFTDSTGATKNFPFTATLTLNFGANLQNDPEPAMYWVFFTNDDPPGDDTGADYGTANAIIVDDFDNVDMQGNANVASVTHTYDYDNNVQRGAGSAGTDVPVTAVAIGLSTGQFVSATGTIQRTTTNAVSLVAALERNYENP